MTSPAAQEPADGWVRLPPLADAHVHLDKTLLGGAWVPHRRGASVAERVAAEISVLEAPGAEPVAIRAERLLTRLVTRGATAVRSHVDISGRLGLARLLPLLELRRRWAGLLDLQLVAFPQEGLLTAPGTTSALRDAVAAGCEVVGGLDPDTVDADRSGHLGAVVALAAETGAGLDVHLHERQSGGARTLLELAERVHDAGLGGRAAVSHGFALADLHRSGDLAPVAGALATAGVTVVTSLPGEGLLPPVPELLAAGVAVVVGSDNIRDCWSPFGQGDPLERASTAAALFGWRNDAALRAALDLVSGAALRLLGQLPEPGPDDGVLVRAGSVGEALVDQPRERTVVFRGREVARDGRLLIAPEPS